jgi:hypothetical protein
VGEEEERGTDSSIRGKMKSALPSPSLFFYRHLPWCSSAIGDFFEEKWREEKKVLVAVEGGDEKRWAEANRRRKKELPSAESAPRER